MSGVVHDISGNRGGAMLSRVAENLFWAARYIERVDGLARLMDQAFQVEFDSGFDNGTTGPVETILEILGCREQCGTETDQAAFKSGQHLMRWLAFGRYGLYSIRSMVAAARENARSTQEALSAEAWNQINRFHLSMSSRKAEARFQASPVRFLEAVKRSCVLFAGLIDATLPRDEAYHFVQLGSYLERIDMTSRILASATRNVLIETAAGEGMPASEELEGLRWTGLLKAVGAQEAYLRRFRGDITSEGVLKFLLLEHEFPRSLRFGLNRCLESLQEIAGPERAKYVPEAERLLGRLESDLRYLEPSDILARGPVVFLGEIQNICAKVGDEIARDCFL